MNQYEKMLLRGLSLAKTVGFCETVYDKVLEKSIDIDKLGIKMYDYERKKNIKEYSLIIIEIYNCASKLYKYKFLENYNNHWQVTYWIPEYDLLYSDFCVTHRVDECSVNNVIDDVVKPASHPSVPYRFNIWYIPDLSYIKNTMDKNVNKDEKIQKLLDDYNILKKEISDETRRFTERINEILKNQNTILDKILQYKGYLKNAKDEQKNLAEENNIVGEQIPKHGAHYEVKYHVFDNFDLITLIKYKKLNAFTDIDEFFYKWIEAQYRTGRFANLYSILSKGLYHNPLDVSVFDCKTPEIGDSIIFLPKEPFDMMNKNVSAVKFEISTKNDIHVRWYDDYSESITYVNYCGNYIMSLYDIFCDYPELKYCDEFYYKNVPAEDEIINKLEKVINI